LPPIAGLGGDFHRERLNLAPAASHNARAMNPYYRICLMVLRLAGGAFLLVGLLDLAAAWLRSRHEHTMLSVGYCAYQIILLVIGAVVLTKSAVWARSLADYLDD